MDIKKIEKLLKKTNTEEKILNNVKRVATFKGKDAQETLVKGGIPLNYIAIAMEELMRANIIVKANVDSSNPNHCSINLARKYRVEDTFIWVKTPTYYINILISIGFILLAFALAMFQLWPSTLKRSGSYLFYPVMAFVVFIMILAVLRLIIFGITFFTHYPGIWLFPNLFADAGFVESFIPLWEYHGVDSKPKKSE
ncbi:Translocation protein sec62 [Astathelohania contejeani]|uniref:Translocation protein SEC62 n=1 Tax=Astathelohania contejeani TaxID=164912 RepID=A0ABQ7HVZ0_9MICR|nr:Translocation protein sec62 [Thelohania contejeani]